MLTKEIISEPSTDREQVAWVLLGLTVLLAAYLGLRAGKTETKIIEKEVPKEVIREVEVVKTVEIPKEVVRTQTDEELLSALLKHAKVAPFNKNLVNCGPVRVVVRVNQEVTEVQDFALKEKAELRLRSLNIPVEDSALCILEISLTGMWVKDGTDHPTTMVKSAVATATGVGLRGFSDGPKILTSYMWMNSYTGYCGSQRVKESCEKSVLDAADSFANAYLAANPR